MLSKTSSLKRKLGKKKKSSMEEARSMEVDGSLKISKLQELAKQQVATVPPRYNHGDIEKASYNSSMLLTQLPVIDMEKLLKIGDDSELERLHSACKEWGFFQVVNHGVSSSLVENVKTEIRAFFQLPLEEKKFEQHEGEIEGYGQHFGFSADHILDWVDLFFMITLPTNLRRPHLFPKLPVSLRDIMEAYCKEINSLAMIILCQFGKALKIDEKEMRDLLSHDVVQSMRINYYPPCPEPDRTIGLSPHTDANTLTILLQLNETEGLEVRKDDIWVPVKPLPNAFIVNVGDMMEVLSNGIYKSIEHRAVANSNEERLSLAAFHSFNADFELGPAPSLIGPNNPPIFRTSHVEKSLQDFAERKKYGKSYIQCMKLETKDDKL